MNKISAFPVFDSRMAGQNYECVDPGMMLRDYFAAKAMQGMLACPQKQQSDPAMYARDAYVIADAMMQARGEV